MSAFKQQIKQIAQRILGKGDLKGKAQAVPVTWKDVWERPGQKLWARLPEPLYVPKPKQQQAIGKGLYMGDECIKQTDKPYLEGMITHLLHEYTVPQSTANRRTGVYDSPPPEWNNEIPFLNPNSMKKDGKKPKQKELFTMFSHLRKLLMDKRKTDYEAECQRALQEARFSSSSTFTSQATGFVPQKEKLPDLSDTSHHENTTSILVGKSEIWGSSAGVLGQHNANHGIPRVAQSPSSYTSSAQHSSDNNSSSSNKENPHGLSKMMEPWHLPFTSESSMHNVSKTDDLSTEKLSLISSTATVVPTDERLSILNCNIPATEHSRTSVEHLNSLEPRMELTQGSCMEDAPSQASSTPGSPGEDEQYPEYVCVMTTDIPDIIDKERTTVDEHGIYMGNMDNPKAKLDVKYLQRTCGCLRTVLIYLNDEDTMPQKRWSTKPPYWGEAPYGDPNNKQKRKKLTKYELKKMYEELRRLCLDSDRERRFITNEPRKAVKKKNKVQVLLGQCFGCTSPQVEDGVAEGKYPQLSSAKTFPEHSTFVEGTRAAPQGSKSSFEPCTGRLKKKLHVSDPQPQNINMPTTYSSSVGVEDMEPDKKKSRTTYSGSTPNLSYIENTPINLPQVHKLSSSNASNDCGPPQKKMCFSKSQSLPCVADQTAVNTIAIHANPVSIDSEVVTPTIQSFRQEKPCNEMLLDGGANLTASLLSENDIVDSFEDGIASSQCIEVDSANSLDEAFINSRANEVPVSKLESVLTEDEFIDLQAVKTFVREQCSSCLETPVKFIKLVYKHIKKNICRSRKKTIEEGYDQDGDVEMVDMSNSAKVGDKTLLTDDLTDDVQIPDIPNQFCSENVDECNVLNDHISNVSNESQNNVASIIEESGTSQNHIVDVTQGDVWNVDINLSRPTMVRVSTASSVLPKNTTEKAQNSFQSSVSLKSTGIRLPVVSPSYHPYTTIDTQTAGTLGLYLYSCNKTI